MSAKKPLAVILMLLLLTASLMYLISVIFENTFLYIHNKKEDKMQDNWIFRLMLNLFGYSTIFIPGLILYYYVKRSKFMEKSDRSWLKYLVKEFFGFDAKGYSNLESVTVQSKQQPLFQTAAQLLFCSFGLLVSYLTWGLIQEKMMTKKYTNSKGESGMFENSQFLVFANRVLAFILSGTCILIMRQPKHTVPLYKYLYCSFSNIISSWCQYEALKFISFPTQVLAKACKLIPVMLMGTIVSKKKYDHYEYFIAILICSGMGLFLFGSADVTKSDQTVTTLSGVILISGYLVFDSFTSNWQSALFTKYSTTSIQMMCGVNFFSCLLTTVSLIQQQSFKESSYFMIQFPDFTIDCLLLSVCSALGQLFIFYTISTFGPVVFVIIMTVRQALAIILSCILYHHEVRTVGVIGISTVFFAIFLRIYWSQKIKSGKKKSQMLPV